MKILLNSKDTNIEQREREIEDLKKKNEESRPEETKNTPNESIVDKNQEEFPKISGVRKQKRISQQKIAARSFITGVDYERSGAMSLYEKF